MRPGPDAVMDAAIAYGAQRVLDGVHADPTWENRHHHELHDDRLLFYDFLHHIVAYEHVMLDSSSENELGDELQPFFADLNHQLGFKWISTRDIGGGAVSVPSVDLVRSSVCRLVVEMVRRGITDCRRIRQVPVPWAYRSTSHHDYDEIAAGLETAQSLVRLFDLG